MNHETPQFNRPETSEVSEWSHPITDRAAHCIEKYAAREGLMPRQTTSPADRSGGIDHRMTLTRDEHEIAIVREVVGEDENVRIVGFNFTIINGVEEPIRFHFHDNFIRLYVAENTIILNADLSQEAAHVMRLVNNSLEGLFSACMAEPDKLHFQIRDGNDRPLSKEMNELIRQHFASMLNPKQLA